MKILVTGCCGFIGSHTCERFLKRGDKVYGIDNMNDYYDPKVKYENLKLLDKYSNFTFGKEDIRYTEIVNQWKPDKVCHLASMAGVRYSIQHPKLYVDVNINGFINLLDQSVKNGVKNFVYASSSSVYGLNTKVPFSEDDEIEKCNSPYACSKKAMEIFAKTYNQLYGIPILGLRFFTVYGPRGRPDMAPYKFMKAIMDQTEFQKYGDGTSSRDYTYIDDIVDGIESAVDNDKELKCEVYNLGNSSPISLNGFIALCEKVVGKKAVYEQIGNQLGDVPHTYADISKAKRDLGYEPKVELEDGLKRMYEWYINNVYDMLYISGELFSRISDVSIYKEKYLKKYPNIKKNCNKIIYADSKITSDVKKIIEQSTIFFVKTDFIKYFEKKILPHITHKFILITHNCDHNSGGLMGILNNNFLIKWYGENMIPHPKTSGIPIGIGNTQYEWSNYSVCKRNSVNKKTNLLYFNFNVKTNKERVNIEKILLKQGFKKNKQKKWENYIEELSKSFFSISPEGNGIDCYRTWESIYVGCIPIVKKNPIMYEHFNELPILWVDNYNIITEEFLLKEKINFEKRGKELRKSTLRYWLDDIKKNIYEYKI